MSSNDSSDIIYYTNVHYNNQNVPIDSTYSSFLSADLLSNQQNYLTGVNKFKISDLSSIPLSDVNIPFEQWQITLKNNNIVHTGFVPQIQTGSIQSGYFYYNLYNNQILKYRVVANTPTIQSTTQIPSAITNPILKCCVDINNIFWLGTSTNIYLVNENGQLLQSIPFQNLVSMSMTRVGQCICCDNGTNTVYLYEFNNGVLYLQNQLSSSFDDAPFTNLNSACFDNSIGVIVSNENKITTINENFTPTNDTTIATPFINPCDSVVLGGSVNTAYILDDEHQVLPPFIVCESVGGDIENFNVISLYDLNDSNRHFMSNNVYSYYSAPTFATGFCYTTNFSMATNYFTSLGVAYAGNISTITLSTQWTNVYSDTGLYPVSCATSPLYNNLLVGIALGGAFVKWDIPSSVWYQYQGATFPFSNPNLWGTVNFDTQGYLWYLYSSNPGEPNNAPILLKSNNILTTTSPIPLFNSEVRTTMNVPMFCITWDLQDPTICYGVQEYGKSGILYKGVYDSVNNTITFSEYRSDNYYCNFVLLSPYYTPNYNVNSVKLYPYNLITSTLGSPQQYTDRIVQSISVDRETNKVYIGDKTSNTIIELTSSLTPSATIPMQNITNVFVIDASDVSMGDVSIYDLQTYINQINQCFANVSNKFVGINTTPTISLDTSTGKLSFTYDTQFSGVNSGVYFNATLFNYLNFTTQATDITGMTKLLLAPSGTMNQSKKSIFKLNQLDKIILETNLQIVGDLTGTLSQSLPIFTDFDIDTSNPDLLQNDSDLLYSAVLMRNYVLNTNTSLRTMDYGFYYQYKNGKKFKFFINPGENVSIKLQFTRKY